MTGRREKQLVINMLMTKKDEKETERNRDGKRQ